MSNKPKRGRPPSNSDLTKSESLLLRLSSGEKQGFADAAALAGLPLSVWMRDRLRRVATTELDKAAQPVSFLEPPKTQLTQKAKTMRLETELNAYGISETPDAFRTRLLDVLLKGFPERSIDSVVCRPDDAVKYCQMIRKEIASNPPDVVILKALMNIRRNKSCPTGLKSPTPKKKLKSKLKDIGWSIGDVAFRELVDDCLADMYKSQTIDEVLCHPPEAAALCVHVRTRADSDVLTDEIILGTLMNNRKSA